MPGGRYYNDLSDFNSVEARLKMEEYLSGEKKLASMQEELKALRERYPVNRADNVKEDILKLERDGDRLRAELRKLRSDVYRLEKSKN